MISSTTSSALLVPFTTSSVPPPRWATLPCLGPPPGRALGELRQLPSSHSFPLPLTHPAFQLPQRAPECAHERGAVHSSDSGAGPFRINRISFRILKCICWSIIEQEINSTQMALTSVASGSTSAYSAAPCLWPDVSSDKLDSRVVAVNLRGMDLADEQNLVHSHRGGHMIERLQREDALGVFRRPATHLQVLNLTKNSLTDEASRSHHSWCRSTCRVTASRTPACSTAPSGV